MLCVYVRRKITAPKCGLTVRSRAPRYLSEEEVALLLSAAPAKDRPLYALVYYTGLRNRRSLAPAVEEHCLAFPYIIVRGKEGWDPKTAAREPFPCTRSW